MLNMRSAVRLLYQNEVVKGCFIHTLEKKPSAGSRTTSMSIPAARACSLNNTEASTAPV
ncbi:hypothetical protein D3C73_1123980 [compost metagenome]